MTIESEQTLAALRLRDARSRFSRRTFLGLAGAAGAAAPFGVLGAAQALTGVGAPAWPVSASEFPLCRTASSNRIVPNPVISPVYSGTSKLTRTWLYAPRW